MDDNDKAFDDLSHWPLEALGGFDAGAIEVRRRAFAAALAAFTEFFDGYGTGEVLEVFEIALDEAWESAGLQPLHARSPDEEG